MEIEEALYQLKQNIKMHELEGTTSNRNEREKALLNYITNLQEENEKLKVNCNIGNENLTFYRNSYKDYKTRNKKAIELIYKVMKERDITGNGTLNLNELLDVLQGEQNE